MSLWAAVVVIAALAAARTTPSAMTEVIETISKPAYNSTRGATPRWSEEQLRAAAPRALAEWLSLPPDTEIVAVDWSILLPSDILQIHVFERLQSISSSTCVVRMHTVTEDRNVDDQASSRLFDPASANTWKRYQLRRPSKPCTPPNLNNTFSATDSATAKTGTERSLLLSELVKSHSNKVRLTCSPELDCRAMLLRAHLSNPVVVHSCREGPSCLAMSFPTDGMNVVHVSSTVQRGRVTAVISSATPPPM